MTCLYVIYATSSYIIYPYFGKETIETFLAITFIISLHKAVCSKRITALLTNETICMVRLVLVIQLFLFRLNLTTTMSTTSCRAATTLVKKNIRYIYEWNCNATQYASVGGIVDHCTTTNVRSISIVIALISILNSSTIL